ncbi:MAG: gliding motility lipoprotein GldH [Bacteroidales bacterium]|jgi:gliding motility-associated lipoprotein GldH|nr:gliding motility lipoprotein GldH [Bacteroidales bacterium]
MMQRIHISPKRTNACTKILFLALLAVVGLCACDPDKIYESNVNIPADGWSRTEHARFEVEITDTVSPCNVYINVRNSSKYKYMELWLFVDVHSPSGALERDTTRIMLADHRGKWLGNGLGDKFDTRMFLRKNVRFPVTGKYVFEYEQGSRDEPLIGIDDIGLRIEKARSQ